MSESHVLSRAAVRTRARRRRPPKRPRGTPHLPWWAATITVVRLGVFYGASASAQKTGRSIETGLWIAYFAWQFWVHWQWRQWERHSGEPRPKITTVMQWFWGALIGSLFVIDIVRYVVTGLTPWEWWVN